MKPVRDIIEMIRNAFEKIRRKEDEKLIVYVTVPGFPLDDEIKGSVLRPPIFVRMKTEVAETKKSTNEFDGSSNKNHMN